MHYASNITTTTAPQIGAPALLLVPSFHHISWGYQGVASFNPPPGCEVQQGSYRTDAVVTIDGIEVGRLQSIHRIKNGGYSVIWGDENLTEHALSRMDVRLLRLLLQADPEVREQGIEMVRSVYGDDEVMHHTARWLVSRLRTPIHAVNIRGTWTVSRHENRAITYGSPCSSVRVDLEKRIFKAAVDRVANDEEE